MDEKGRGHCGLDLRLGERDKMKRSKALFKWPTLNTLSCVVYMEWRAKVTFFAISSSSS